MEYCCVKENREVEAAFHQYTTLIQAILELTVRIPNRHSCLLRAIIFLNIFHPVGHCSNRTPNCFLIFSVSIWTILSICCNFIFNASTIHGFRSFLMRWLFSTLQSKHKHFLSYSFTFFHAWITMTRERLISSIRYPYYSHFWVLIYCIFLA